MIKMTQSRSLSMRHISQTPPCEPGSDAPPDWSGSWNPNQIPPTLPCKSQASKTSGSLCRDRRSHLTQFLNLMTPHMDSSSNSWVFSSVQKGDKMPERQADPIAEGATAKQKASAQSLRVCSSCTQFSTPEGTEPGNIPSKRRTDWTRKGKNAVLGNRQFYFVEHRQIGYWLLWSLLRNRRMSTTIRYYEVRVSQRSQH